MAVFSLSRLSSYPQLSLWVKLWHLAQFERPDPDRRFQTNANRSNSLVKILLPKKNNSPEAMVSGLPTHRPTSFQCTPRLCDRNEKADHWSPA